jgi:DNA-binding transcriptional LysR family regulator
MKRDLNVDQIKKLWVLNLIIQSGSLKKAALQAKVSPSAISQTLTSLERSMGKSLLIRSGGAITPTADARAILEVVQPAFAAFDRLKDLNNIPLPEMTWLNFGTYESIAVDILPGLIHRLRTTMPHLRLGVRISRTSNLLTMIRKGELCSALITEVDDLDRFYGVDVYEDRLGFFVSQRHPIAQMGWKAAHYFGIGTLTQSKDGMPRYFTRFHKQLGNLRPTVHSDSFETLRSAAAAGVLVSVLPHRVAHRHDDLVEIFPVGAKNKEQGLHRLLVVSQTNCDHQEVDFLAAEARRLLPQNQNQ